MHFLSTAETVLSGPKALGKVVGCAVEALSDLAAHQAGIWEDSHLSAEYRSVRAGLIVPDNWTSRQVVPVARKALDLAGAIGGEFLGGSRKYSRETLLIVRWT